MMFRYEVKTKLLKYKYMFSLLLRIVIVIQPSYYYFFYILLLFT